MAYMWASWWLNGANNLKLRWGVGPREAIAMLSLPAMNKRPGNSQSDWQRELKQQLRENKFSCRPF
jgi:hypothetical protein